MLNHARNLAHLIMEATDESLIKSLFNELDKMDYERTECMLAAERDTGRLPPMKYTSGLHDWNKVDK